LPDWAPPRGIWTTSALPSPVVVEAHGFGIDGNRIAVAADIRQIAAMQANRHDLSPKFRLWASPRRAGAPVISRQAFENKQLLPYSGTGVAQAGLPQKRTLSVIAISCENSLGWRGI
jgi:hypothetical protein